MTLDPDHALFVAILDSGSIAATARASGTSPAMVSKRLARLEARLGVRLIERTTRRLHPTPVGTQLHADLTQILAALAAAEARVTGAASAPAGPLRIAAPTSFARLHIAPHLGDFLRLYPAVALELTLSDGYVDLAAGRIDCAIRITADPPAGYVARRLAGNRRVVCASPAYLAAHGVPTSPAALAGHRLLAAEGQLPWTLLRPARRAVVEGVSHVRTDSSEIVRELALAGVGIALRSLWDVGKALADGRLVRVLPEWEGAHDLAIHALHAAQPRPAVSAFIDFLADRLSPPPWEPLDTSVG
ncbi:LysR family transcriptional regulator [Sphingomonas sp. Leaf24]|uniref:LysR family transcriptional regulator n=1 Tax=unclassified Sphingomonas TaxID=196159 RepID=UPI0006FA56BD|nr:MULTISPECIES: LysR family transcriptional regulator [unclassified Sphingomonas]KQM14589.1 LysR family transcriptional regulator [Sphingomonas sp. Leaf5]KQM87890.1 LysR family transcriptional regulator [Sphingomonas sp. Leaf24]